MRRRWQLTGSWFMVHGAYKAFGGHSGRLRKIPLRKVHFHGVVTFAIAAIDV